MNSVPGITLCIWLSSVAVAMPGQHTGTRQSSRLYTAPDPSAGGGIHARVISSAPPLLNVFAVPADNPFRVYQGAIGTDGHEFSFKGLPVAKYDLMLVSQDQFIEGFTLSAEPDTLTEQDRERIEVTIMKSIPFFDTKQIHRCIGVTGSDGKAGCVLQEVRTRPVTLQDATERSDIQVRSIKLAFLKDAGSAGWQLDQTREILRTEVTPMDRKGVLPHGYNPLLHGIRVTDSIKELEEIDLTKGAVLSSVRMERNKPRPIESAP